MAIFSEENWKKLWERHREISGYGWWEQRKRPVDKLDILVAIVSLFFVGIVYIIIRYIIIDGLCYLLAGTSLPYTFTLGLFTLGPFLQIIAVVYLVTKIIRKQISFFPKLLFAILTITGFILEITALRL